jgi:hypothetical protein
MRTTGILTLSAGLFFSCATTYYQAGVKNNKRFEGGEREDAEYLMETSDDLLLLKTLSTSAKEKTDSKQVFLNADFLIERIKDHEFKVQLLAKSRRIALATELSEQADNKLHSLLNYEGQIFDSVYVAFVHERLQLIKNRSQKYKKTGMDESIAKLSVNLAEMSQEALSRFSDQD